MMIDRLYFQAIKELPPEYITDDLRVLQVDKHVVLSAHPELAPMSYSEKHGWQLLRLFDLEQ